MANDVKLLNLPRRMLGSNPAQSDIFRRDNQHTGAIEAQLSVCTHASGVVPYPTT